MKKKLKFDFKGKIKNYKNFEKKNQEKKYKFELTLPWSWSAAKSKLIGFNAPATSN